ncbi:MAG TPA: bifunctional precorrin-2 dehydrogenase/sirohydrochlorin ferrochelatase [Verrucomicrobiae bacterium]|nr:bifunctional precorrin-2 dehydrogenase/sirohydrochlorin ferrochelatase [Verrucomicrobiae bacterium]
MRHYPLFLNLTDQLVIVIGAGAVGARKIRSLLAVGARVTVISPHAARLPEGVRWLRRRYRQGDLRGARLVVAATDDLAVNERVCAEAKRRKLLVNCVAPPSAGNFIVPAVARRGRLTIAVSTGGASPALAKRLRRDLERLLRKDYPQLRDG